MKRFWIILLATAMALVVALPAGAGKPCCPDTEDCRLLELAPTPHRPTCAPDTTPTLPPQDDVDCAFTDAGVLTSPDGTATIALGVENMSYRCKLIADPSDSFEFTIGTVDGATALLQPMIAVTDAYPSGDMCFREFEVGRMAADLVDGVGIFVRYSMGGLPLTEDDEYGECDFMDTTFVSEGKSDTYTLTFQTGKAKGGTVQLEMTDAHGDAPMQ